MGSAALRDHETAFRVREDGVHLLARHAGKPIEEIRHCRAVFKIFEERSHWHTRAFEQPCPADLARHAFDSGTFIPIQHDRMLTPNPSFAKWLIPHRPASLLFSTVTLPSKRLCAMGNFSIVQGNLATTGWP